MNARITPMIALTLAVLALATACPNAPAGGDGGTRGGRVAHRAPTATLELGEPTVVDAGVVAAAPRTLLDDEALPRPDDDEANYEEVGDALLALGKTGDAINAYRTALSAGATASVWRKLGDAYVKQGDVARGKKSLLEALSADPLATEPRRSLARVALDENDGATARMFGEELVARAPDDIDGRRVLGRAYLQLSMWKEAIGEIEKVVMVKPDDPYAHNNIGFAALQIGELEKARDHLERCLSLEPQQGFMLNNLGVAYERLGRRAEAHAAFARAAELNPKYSSALLNRERMAMRLSDEERLESAETLLSLRTPPVDGGSVPAGVASDDVGGDADIDMAEGGDGDDALGGAGGSARLAPSP
jgi:Flp pilus assembly protein TadD